MSGSFLATGIQTPFHKVFLDRLSFAVLVSYFVPKFSNIYLL